ncbi:MAG: protein-L-isoaspartate O-methyltransferase [Caulobacterales bacterium]|nr:protein-L-isoaspartate O-methyltransferase [Caulobacterales bacterium]
MDFARARDIMVESQVRPADVTDPRLAAAMRHLPRERFTPAQKRQMAYADMEVEVAPGRTLMRPRDLAKLLQALAPQAGDRALEIAGATGYGAAVLATLCKDVVAHDPDPDLSFTARAALESCGLTNAKTVTTPALEGWRDEAPYNVILLNGSTEIVPDAWLAQLAPGGRLGVIVRQGPAGSARIYTRADSAVAYRTVFDAAPPIAPGLVKPATFAL